MKRYRSAETGEYVSKEYADENPSTTVSEEVEEDMDVQIDFDDEIPF